MPDSTLFEKHHHIEVADTLPYLLYKSTMAIKSTEPPPLLIFLHGAGERGNDNYQQLRHCVNRFLHDTVSGQYPFLLLLPQCPKKQRWVNTDWTLPSHSMEPQPTAQLSGVKALIDSLKSANAIDSTRIYICGISMGGFGVWDALQRWPGTFAAAIAICGGGDPAYASRIKDKPLYIFHGDKDKLVKPIRSRQMYLALKKLNSKKLHYIHYTKLGHFCWDRALATPNIFKWLFSQTVKSTKHGQKK
jgi:predicted peptidase